ncbi:unnamed protein product, partial [Ectocarpus sp. 8 AP-2014]
PLPQISEFCLHLLNTHQSTTEHPSPYTLPLNTYHGIFNNNTTPTNLRQNDVVFTSNSNKNFCDGFHSHAGTLYATDYRTTQRLTSSVSACDTNPPHHINLCRCRYRREVSTDVPPSSMLPSPLLCHY